MFKLICDNREKKVLNALKKELDKKATYSLIKNHCLHLSDDELDASFEIRINDELVCNCLISRLDEEYSHPLIVYENDQLKVGDYIITQGGNNYPLAVIERKTLADFSSSIKDKRHYNYEKLLKLRELTNCKIFYFIEGSIDELKYSSSIAGIKFFSIFSSFLSLQIKYDIHIIYTRNETDTARKLKFLAEKMANLFIKGELTIKTELGDTTFNECMNKSDFTELEKMNKNVWGMWESIPQIGRETAKRLSSEFCIKEYINGSLNNDLLNNLKLKPKQLNILRIKPDEKIATNILSNIPSISKMKATKLLTSTTINNLANNNISNKIPGLGKKTLEIINKYMNIILKESNEIVNNSNIENIIADNSI
jgi:ERCC4-type nuclease